MRHESLFFGKKGRVRFDPVVIDRAGATRRQDGGEDNQYDLDLIVEGSRAELFKYHDEASGSTYTWYVAILKQSVCPADCQQFIDWIEEEMDEAAWTGMGVEKP